MGPAPSILGMASLPLLRRYSLVDGKGSDTLSRYRPQDVCPRAGVRIHEPNDRSEYLKKLVRISGPLALVAGLLWAGKQLAASGMLATLGHARPSMLVAAFGAVATANLMAAGRWWSLAPAGHGYARLARINVESHFWATVIPGGVAADGYRILALKGRGACPHRAAASVMLERAFGLVALLVLCGPALGIGAQWLSMKLLVSLSVLAGALSLMVAGATAGALWGPAGRGKVNWLPAKVRKACAGLEDAFGAYRGQRRQLLRAMAFALGYHAAFLAVYALVGRAMGVDMSLGRWFIAVPLATLSATLPLNAWGIGVREGAMVLLLVALGVSPGKAGAVSIAVVGLQLALGCSGGLSQLLRRRPAPVAV